jgi:hypothetical protein
MRQKGTNHAKDVQEKTLAVLTTLCDGDLFEALSAYGVIYPQLWKTCLNEEELKLYGDDIEKGIAKY